MGNLFVAGGIFVFCEVERESEEREYFTRLRTDQGAVLADASCEDQGIKPSEAGEQGADSRAQPVDVDLQRESCALVPLRMWVV